MTAFAALLAGCGQPAVPSDGRVTTVPVTDDDVRLLVRGWDRDALDQILSDFEQKYGLARSTLIVEETGADEFEIRLGQPLPAHQLLYLVNYVHYPEAFDFRNTARLVVAVVQLSKPFGPPSSLAGQRAILYVPANDTNYDEVFAKSEAGATYQISFTDMKWRPMAEDRQPMGLSDLASAAVHGN